MAQSNQRSIEVEKGTRMHERFLSHFNNNQPINYHEVTDHTSRGKYKINHYKDGLPGHVNFYVTRLDGWV